MKAGCTYVNTTEKTETSYFLAIYGQFRNISRLLRRDDFTTDLTQGEKFSGFFFFFNFVVIQPKTYTSLVSTSSLSIYDKTVAKKS